jgi:glyoxylase-like metal-dependent hydrolase (beta-lactamase superfamily II)
MRATRSRIALGAAATIAAAVGVALTRRATGSAAPALEPTEIAPGVSCIGPWGRTQTNVYVVLAGRSAVLVDAGWAGDATRIQAAVRTLLGPERVPSAIVLTHVHPDHAGSARALAETWRCPILVHPAECPVATGDFAAMQRDAGPLDRWVILPAMRAIGTRRRERVLAAGSLAGLTRELPSDGKVPALDGWTWLATPGHTRGHVALVRETDRVVLTGDALVTLRVNEAAGLLGRPGLTGPPWYTTWDGSAAMASIDAIAALEPTVIGGGHGRPLSGVGTASAVAAFARRGARPGAVEQPRITVSRRT